MNYKQKKKQLIKELNLVKHSGNVSLGKSTSNLFRSRKDKTKKINVRNFNKIIKIDVKNKTAEVEGMTTYEDFVDATLPFNLMPTVVPELKTITVGGAVSGIGLESSSFRYGFVHETVLEMEILTGDGKVITATKTNKYKDLFFGFPNTYGTLGYVLKIKIQLVDVKKYVKITRLRFTDIDKFFKEYKQLTLKYLNDMSIGFIQAFCFSKNEIYIEICEFIDHAPYTSNYKFMNIFYKSSRKKKEDYLTIYDYIWRYDADWIWCSKNIGMENRILRFLFGKFILNSKAYWKIMTLSRRWGITTILEKFRKKKHETIIQDVDITIDKAPTFLKWFLKEINIIPVMIVATTVIDKKRPFTFFNLNPKKMNISIGFYDIKPTIHEEGYYNRKIEQKAKELGAQKMLYSACYYSQEEFWKIYDKRTYDTLKTKYDPSRTFKNLYEKCVKRA